MLIKIKWSLARSFSSLLAIIIGLSGFSISCKKESKYGTPNAEYGTPYADFLLKGTVKSKTDQSVLPDIKVTMAANTVQTNGAGFFQVAVNGIFPEAHTFNVNFHDLDTLANGNFKDKDTTISFPGTNFTGGDGAWYEGTEIKTTEVFLEPKP
jgi:putative lipoprotein (rSAM/lipoprotein system)